MAGSDPNAREPDEPSGPASSVTGPRLGGSVFPVSRESPVELGRYSVIGVLGRGGMGVVYEAIDRERGQVVALKTLRRLDPHGLRRLKAEFRAVADVVNENLVLLFELVADDDDLFFAMEYVEGEGFLDHVRGTKRLPASASMPSAVRATASLAADATRVEGRAQSHGCEGDDETMAPPLDAAGIERLKAAVIQVVSGLSALHRAGKFHRDVKPSNVRVTPRGRVVVLDFGLVKDDVGADLYGPTAGTPSYMAPEQVTGERVTAATDLYAVGVMMYEALVGRKPFEGSPTYVLASKVHSLPDSPRSHVPSVPEELDALCMDLLRVPPGDRPSAAEVVLRLGGILETSPQSGAGASSSNLDGPSSIRWHDTGPISRPTSASPTSPFGPASTEASPGAASVAMELFGRNAELATLFASHEAARAGRTVAVAVSGLSGVGKSAIVRTFLDTLVSRGDAVVLEGRCYERESVRFKAFDDIVDGLGQVLRLMPWPERVELLPPGIGELARIFPVLSDLAIAAGSAKPDIAPDPVELQRRAFACLKALLAGLAEKRPLVLYVDDLQWGDKDSGRLLIELLSPPDRPTFMLVYTFRREEASGSALLKDLARHDLGETIRDLQIGPLSLEDSTSLAGALLAQAVERVPEGLDVAIARESEGSPFFVEQLVRHVAAGGAVSVSLAELISARIANLPDEARRTLEVVALAARPLEQGIVERAAQLARTDRATIPLLRSQALVRTRGARRRDTVETFHDRVRDHVTRGLAEPLRRKHHLALADALETSGRADARDLALHYHGGGDLPRAYRHALRAADDEARGLAFDRAADLFMLALDCGTAATSELDVVRVRLAETLVSAGRSAEAAPHFLAAAERASGLRGTDLRRLAAEQLLVSGRFDEGVHVLGPVLEAVGLSFPKSPRRALVSMIARIAELEVTGTGFVSRDEPEVSPTALARVDVAWSAGKGLLTIDSVRGGYFFVRALQLALRAGEPKRVARSLAMYGMMNVYGGDERGERKGTLLLDRAVDLAHALADPAVEGTVAICRGTARMSVGAWRDGIELMESGIDILESKAIGVGWECSTGRSSCFNARLWLGELAVIADRAPAWSRSAERLGDRFSWVTAELYAAIVELAADEPAAARSRARRGIARWSESGFHFQHWLALKVEIYCDLYEGFGDRAFERLTSAWQTFEGSGLLRIQLMRLDAYLLRGTVALASGRAGRATRDASLLENEGRPSAIGAAALLRGGVAASQRRYREARESYSLAARELGRADVRLHAAAAVLAQDVASAADGAEASRAAALLTAEGITRPDRYLRMLAPQQRP